MKGYVYILQNKAYPPDLLKIGMTTRTPEIRANELYENSSGVPHRFTVAFKREVANCEEAEAISHKRLNAFRNNQFREFFTIPQEQAEKVLNEVCTEIDSLYSDKKSLSPDSICIMNSSYETPEEEIARMTSEAKLRLESKYFEFVPTPKKEQVIEVEECISPKFRWRWYHLILIAATLRVIFALFGN